MTRLLLGTPLFGFIQRTTKDCWSMGLRTWVAPRASWMAPRHMASRNKGWEVKSFMFFVWDEAGFCGCKGSTVVLKTDAVAVLQSVDFDFMRRLIGLGFDFLHFGRGRALPEIRCRGTTTNPRTEILSKTSVVRLSWSTYIGTIEIETTSTTTVLTGESRRGLVVRLLAVVSRLAAGWVRFFEWAPFQGGMTFDFAATILPQYS